MCLYIVILALIFFQNRIFKKPKRKILVWVNLLLLTFLAFYQFVFEGWRIFDFQPFQIIPLTFALGLYFLGLLVFEASYSSRKNFSEIRLIAPFALPFMLLVFFFDLLQFFPSKIFTNDSPLGNFLFFVLTILVLGILMIFLPYWIQKIWNCKPLNRPNLEERLNEICKRANFNHAGFKTWTVLNHSLTAAIIGIVPRYRYILFTRRLLDEMPEHSIEAILVHEIGHSYHKHLLIYPFIILGMSVGIGLLSYLFHPLLADFLNSMYLIYPSQLWSSVYPLLLFAFYAIGVLIYFRIVFGLFSRLFERQADLHVFTLGIPAQYMIEALDYIGKVTNSHHTPNWHHWGIQQRIDMLKQAIEDPRVVAQHSRCVRKYLVGYFILLAVASIVLFLI